MSSFREEHQIAGLTVVLIRLSLGGRFNLDFQLMSSLKERKTFIQFKFHNLFPLFRNTNTDCQS